MNGIAERLTPYEHSCKRVCALRLAIASLEADLAQIFCIELDVDQTFHASVATRNSVAANRQCPRYHDPSPLPVSHHPVKSPLSNPCKAQFQQPLRLADECHLPLMSTTGMPHTRLTSLQLFTFQAIRELLPPLFWQSPLIEESNLSITRW